MDRAQLSRAASIRARAVGGQGAVADRPAATPRTVSRQRTLGSSRSAVSMASSENS